MNGTDEVRLRVGAFRKTFALFAPHPLPSSSRWGRRMSNKTGGPFDVASTTSADAWWYQNRNSIDVVVETETGVFCVRINRKRLAEWVAATEPTK